MACLCACATCLALPCAAAPPVGELRFKSPQAPLPWTTVLNVTTPPPKCSSGSAWSILDKNAIVGTEDCLFLNVYVPIKALPQSALRSDGSLDLSGAGLPVMQWIYGGGWIFGDSWDDGKYSGHHLATLNNAVVVAGNYRLGPFGFMALPALAQENADGSTGNYALQDQTAALKWTQANIAAFGGNPSRVGIFGESAGGFSICWHMVSPASAGLFHAAAMQSGSCDSPTFFRTPQRAYAWAGNYSVAAGCPGSGAEQLKCLRALTAAQLQNVPWENAGGPVDPTHFKPDLYPVMPWGAMIDGAATGLLATPLESMKAGKFNRVPFLLGSNAQDGAIFAFLLPVVAPTTDKATLLAQKQALRAGLALPMSASQVRGGMRALLSAGPHSGATPAHVAAVDSIIQEITAEGGLYPLTDAASTDNFETVGRLITQYFFACGARRTARAVTAAGVPAYLYQFTAKVESSTMYKLLGDYHSLEVGLLFGTKDIAADSQAVSQAMGAYWGGMAVGGSPNAAVAPGFGNTTLANWPAFDWSGDRYNMKLQTPLQLQADLFSTECAYWDNHFQVANQPTPLL